MPDPALLRYCRPSPSVVRFEFRDWDGRHDVAEYDDMRHTDGMAVPGFLLSDVGRLLDGNPVNGCVRVSQNLIDRLLGLAIAVTDDDHGECIDCGAVNEDCRPFCPRRGSLQSGGAL